MGLFPNSPYAVPKPSFPQPVVPPSTEPDAAPFATVRVNCDWLPFIRGALFQLTLQSTWKGTLPDINLAQDRANKLIQMFLGIGPGDCGIPELPPFGVGGEIDLMTGIRVDCNCNVFVTCCDGTEVQLLTTKYPGSPQPGQPGAGSPQAPPAGGTAVTCYTLDGDEQLALAQRVSSGDVLEFEALMGSWYDTTYLNILKCPDGWFYINGACFEDIGRIGSDPVPTVPHMALVVEIDGTFYDGLNLDAFGAPQPFTVPPGHTDAIVYVQANNSTLSTGHGSVSFCVKVTNNAVPSFTHNFNFEASPAGWLPANNGNGPLAVWSPANGYKSVTGVDGPHDTQTDIHILFPAREIDSIEVFYQTDQTNATGSRVVLYKAGGGYLNYGALNTGVGIFDTVISNPIAGVSELYISVDRDQVPFGNFVITGAIVKGKGVDPF